MRWLLIVLLVLFYAGVCSAQLNVELLHQLVAESKSEHAKQADARDRQMEAMANEEVNRSLMSRLKSKYRDIQTRFAVLGTAISVLQVGMDAYPLVSDIISDQQRIYELCKDDPVLVALAAESEIDMGDRASRLVDFLYGVCLSFGDINQMKQSDRKILFSHVVSELRLIAGASRGLADSLYYSARKKSFSALNPFSGFINTDRAIIERILKKIN